MIYKFVKWEPIDFAKLANYRETVLHAKCEAKEPLTRQEKNHLVFCDYAPVHKYGGWAFDFRPYLRTFWVQTKYYKINQYYASDKTAIRDHLANKGDPIIRIVDVTKE